MHRLFVALHPPEFVRDLLIDAMDDGAHFRWQSDDQLHLTLRFIGEVERPLADDLAQALTSIRAPAFELRLSGLGSFDRRSGGVLWAGVEPAEPVRALAARIERICQAAGLAPERRAFHPHITLARWRGPRSREARGFLDGRLLGSPPFAVESFILYESHLSRHGAQYNEVESFPLS
ncbi:MAG: RNA 2',3'-cyclic phosphodiesterase [Sphingomicrobium sp.]